MILSNVLSVFTYLFIYAVSTMSLYIYERRVNNKLLLVIAVLLPVILSVVRFQVGTDYSNYYLLFTQLGNMNFAGVLKSQLNYESGFVIISFFLMKLLKNEQLVFGAYSFMILFFYLKGYKKLFGNKKLSLFYFIILLSSFSASFNVLRQIIAVAICFYALNFVIEKKIKKYIFFILMALSIHNSSIIALPIYFVFQLNSKKNSLSAIIKLYFSILMTFLVIFLLFPNQLIEIFNQGYNYLMNNQGGGAMTTSINIIIVTFISSISINISNTNIKQLLYANLPLYLLLLFLSYSSPVIGRLTSFYSWILVFLYIYLSDSFKEKKMINMLIISYYILSFILVNGILLQGDLIPFKIFLIK